MPASRIFTVAICLLLFFTGITAFVKKADEPLDKISASLSNWTTTLPQEKVYLHTDKPYYALGDTIWFKAYVTVGSRHQLSALSGALYAELINEKDSVERTLKLPVLAGMAKGDFIISDTLSEGNYRIRAYTQWMRNAGEEFFFDKTFTVGNAIDNEVSAKADFKYQTIDNNLVVTTILCYTDSSGQPVADKEVEYTVINNQKVLERRKAKTDANGTISINTVNNEKSSLKGAHVLASIITSANKKLSKTFTIKVASSQSDVQFFAEGGDMVTNINSRVAFKATGIDGLGVPIKGSVVDNDGKEITTFESLHAGMGSFNLKPLSGKSYTAKVAFPNGSLSSINLPKAKESGYVLAVYNSGVDSLLVRINASQTLLQTPQAVNLVVQTGGEMLYASQIKISRPATSVWIAKKDFPTGIAQFTLFNTTGEPINERIAFIRTKDRMELKINTAKAAYASRDKVEMELSAADKNGQPVIGSFSVSVIDETKVPVNEAAETTILSSLLLSADIKGYIEQPNYYFTNESDEVNKALDNLMLTQGYRRFTWKALLAAGPVKPLYKAEKVSSDISGRLLTLTKKPVVKGKVTLLSLKTGIVTDTTTDADGYFNFDKLVLTDSIKFTVQGRGAKNSSLVQILMDKVPGQSINANPNIADINTDISGSSKTYLASNKKQIEVLEKLGKLNRVQQLQGVSIRAKQVNKSTLRGILSVPDANADHVFVLEKAEACANLGTCLQGRLAGVMMMPRAGSNFYPHFYDSKGMKYVPMQVIVDGRNVDSTEVADIMDNNGIEPVNVIKVLVVRTSVMTSVLGFPSIVIITKGNNIRNPHHPELAQISPRGFSRAREFYIPKYNHPKTVTELPDLRSTIYWNPEVKTGADGKAKFSFFNADDPGNYKVIIEGINAAGELGRQVYRYKVE
ncbi:TonB-dependent receptor plug domain-containing protein [Mucilaginibacter gynuensis]|uniref:TonB-dependent receptor plug domain-containing protein n=1 Tax=Mucilaginibacter gynuensis TaxID=1302236 RepID=A0ABP8H639_9SPHI